MTQRVPEEFCIISLEGQESSSEVPHQEPLEKLAEPIDPTEDTKTKTPKKKMFRGFPSTNDPIFKNPDIRAKPAEIIEDKGYPCEFHEVISSDGYVISLFRIPHGKHDRSSATNGSTQDRPAVLFAHGILNHGAMWIMNSPEVVLPYRLADKGYDCWLLNARGCDYSKKHVEHPTRSRRFWRFGWEEMAMHDLPIVINYILNTSRQQQVTYIGHSMGCTVLFAAVSFDPELAKKIKIFIAFAPAVYLKKARSIFVKLASKFSRITRALSGFYFGEFCLRPSLKMIYLAPWVWCWRQRALHDATWFLLQFSNLINGSNKDQINWPLLPVVTANCPSPTSAKAYSHFLQLCSSGEFRRYDYGTRKNYRMYGKPVPPTFDLSKSTFPVAIFSGENDYCVHPEDAQRLASQLPNLVRHHVVEHPKFNHFDFLVAKDADTLLYDHVVKILDAHSNSVSVVNHNEMLACL